MASTVIYEVECQLDPDIVPDYDDWLPGHVRDVLACAGFLGATIDATEAPAGERRVLTRSKEVIFFGLARTGVLPQLRRTGRGRPLRRLRPGRRRARAVDA